MSPLHLALLFIVAVLPVCLSGQPKEVTDSLKQALANETGERQKIPLLRELYGVYRRINLDSASLFAENWLALSLNKGLDLDIAESFYAMGVIAKEQGNYDSAVQYIAEAQYYFEKSRAVEGIISCITESAAINYKQGYYEKAIADIHTLQNYYADSITSEKMSRLYNMTGSIYKSLKQFDKALEQYRKSLEINLANGFELGVSANYNNIGNVYKDMKRIPEAIENYLASMEIKERIGDKIGIASLLNNLGLAHLELGNTGQAIEYHFQSMKQYSEAGDEQGVSTILVNLGADHLKAGNYVTSIEYSHKGLALSSTHNIIENIAEAYGNLTKASASLGRFKDAYLYHLQYDVFKDSLANDRVIEKITRLENRHALEKKEKEIALINADREKQKADNKRQRTINNLMTATVLLSMVVLALFFSSFRHRQKVNRKLQEINETKSRFFANISHEFRTPLTLLSGPLEDLIKRNRPEDKQTLEMMYRNINRLLLLNNQLMDLSRLESGAIRLRLKKGFICMALKGMAMSFESLARQKNITMNYIFPENDIECYFDQDKLEKTVYNLLANAIKFTPGYGKVSFSVLYTSDEQRQKRNSTTKDGCGNLEIQVSDTGKGIATEHLPHIFDRFYQADNNLNREYEGTGLGLAITRELVEIHCGRISVASEAGKGSTFTVVIPLDLSKYPPGCIAGASGLQDVQYKPFFKRVTDDPDTSASDSEVVDTDSKEASAREEIPHLLIVEDNADMRTYIRSALGNDFIFSTAPDGEKGFSLATESIPDLIISDLMMPKMDGVELTAKLKTDERTSHIPVIMLTALATVEHRIKGLETGADDYLTKPFNRNELKTRCINLIEQRKKLHLIYARSVSIDPADIKVTSSDERFLQKIVAILENHISNPELDVDFLLREVAMSRSQLHKKLKGLTGLSTTEFVRNFRLKRAATLLKGNFGSVADVCYAVGFNTLSYFTRSFSEQFGMSPSAYSKKEREGQPGGG